MGTLLIINWSALAGVVVFIGMTGLYIDVFDYPGYERTRNVLASWFVGSITVTLLYGAVLFTGWGLVL